MKYLDTLFSYAVRLLLCFKGKVNFEDFQSNRVMFYGK